MIANALRLAALVAAAGFAAGAPAQGFPAKPVHFIVPYSAGGSADLLARVIGEQVSEYWGKPVVVENRPGAGSIVASQYVQHAPPDGYNLLLMAPSFIVNPMLKKEAGYDPVRDFTPVGLLVTSPLVLVVNPTLPVKTLMELGDPSHADAGKFSFAAVGPGTTQQMIGEMLRIEGRFDAVGSRERIETLKDVPTFTELGYEMVDGTIWFGFMASAGTPREAVQRLQADIGRALKVPAVHDKLVAQSLYPVESTPEEFGAFLETQVQKYSRVIRQAGIRAD